MGSVDDCTRDDVAHICDPLRRQAGQLLDELCGETLNEIPYVFSEAMLRLRRRQNTNLVRGLLARHGKTIDDVARELGWKRSTAGAVRLGNITLERFQEINDVYNHDGLLALPPRSEHVAIAVISAMEYLSQGLRQTSSYPIDTSAFERICILASSDEWVTTMNAIPRNQDTIAELGNQVLSMVHGSMWEPTIDAVEELVNLSDDWLLIYAVVVGELPSAVSGASVSN